MTVLVVGEALVDVVQAADGTEQAHPGGSPFNVAIGLSRLGIDAHLAGQIGDDDYGRLLDQTLRDAEVGRVDVGTADSTSTAHATLNDDGSANYTFDLSWEVGSLPDPTDYEAIHVGSLGTFVEPGASQVADLVHTADVMGVPVSFDPNVRLAVSDDAAAWRQAFARIAPHARIIKLSDEDAAVLHHDVSASDLARRLASEGALVAITQGAGGSLVAHRDRLVVVDAPAVQVADTIGAGDSFMAAMLGWCAMYQWPNPDELEVGELHDLGDYATRAAAITVSRPGANPPHADEL